MNGSNLADPKVVDFVEKINQRVHQTHVELYRFWLENMLFTWHWWVDVGLSILPWIFWIIVRKKDSTHRLLFAGFTLLIIVSFLDFLGLALGLWGYNYKVVPLVPPYIPWDFTLFPVMAMLFYQFKPKINPIIKAVCFSGLSSFIIQPIFQLLGFYNPKGWKHYYSFPIIIVIYLIGHYITTRSNFEKL